MYRSDIRILPFAGRFGLLTRLVRTLSEAIIRQRERQSLGHLDAHLLRDIGLSPEQARIEAAKPFWQA